MPSSDTLLGLFRGKRVYTVGASIGVTVAASQHNGLGFEYFNEPCRRWRQDIRPEGSAPPTRQTRSLTRLPRRVVEVRSFAEKRTASGRRDTDCGPPVGG
jgi:hypothetical protein